MNSRHPACAERRPSLRGSLFPAAARYGVEGGVVAFEFVGMASRWPTWIVFQSAMLLKSASAVGVMPNCSAMLVIVSPDWTK